MNNIETELDNLIGIEGGYSNDPTDSGGETNWGITVFTARAFGYTGSMKDMTKDQAKDIYRAKFWVQPRFDQVFNISSSIAFELFDTGVNAGVSTAGKFLQRCLNVLNIGATIYPDMTVDGSVGAMTLNALKSYLDYRRKDGGESVLLKMLNGLQSAYYIELAENRSKDEKYEFGWQKNRIII